MADVKKKNVLFIPSVKKGNGTGHFRRCLSFSHSDSINGKIFLSGGDHPDQYSLFELKSSIPNLTSHMTVQSVEGGWDLIVLDQRNTPSSLLESLPGGVPVIALDEGSPKDSMDYLIDLLPSPGKRNVNIFNPLLGIDPSIPVKKDNGGGRGKNILVTFGGEDQKDLTAGTLSALSRYANTAGGLSITAVQGPMFSRGIEMPGIRILKNPENLSRKLHAYDLVITSFGVTSFEAVRAGLPVVHVNPSDYHTKLSKNAGFPVAGTGRVNGKALIRLTESALSGSLTSRYSEPGDQVGYFPDYIAGLSLKKESCPFCRSSGRTVLERFPERSFFKCRSCGIVYQARSFDHGISYGARYFFDEYKSQYGKTYLEDFDHIKETGGTRLARARRLLRPGEGTGTVLDIGCAYGPFMTAAFEAGLHPTGFDISAEAVEYVKETLGLEAYEAVFPDAVPGEVAGRTFDIVSMWYVIEHFGDIGSVLKKTAEFCRDGSVFCFSTPNLNGISALKDRRAFLMNSPSDHTVILSPKSAANILSRAGFKKAKTVATGIHRQRMPAWMAWLPDMFLTRIARLLHLGDTFELYAVRRRSE